MKKLSAEQVNELSHALRETADSIEMHLELTLNVEAEDYDIEEIESQLADHAERCSLCGWWYEPGELIAIDDDEAETGLCDDCR